MMTGRWLDEKESGKTYRAEMLSTSRWGRLRDPSLLRFATKPFYLGRKDDMPKRRTSSSPCGA